MSGPELIEGRFVKLSCPWCGADTYAVPGVAAMACATHARAWFGAVEPVRPVPGANNGLRLGQGGAAGWRHEPRNRAPIVEREAGPAPLVLIPVCPVSAGDGAPATVAALCVRVSGAALYAAALLPDGPASAVGLDRWVLREAIVVKWDRGFATWGRSGRGKWILGVAWWRDPLDGGWRYGKHAGIPS